MTVTFICFGLIIVFGLLRPADSEALNLIITVLQGILAGIGIHTLITWRNFNTDMQMEAKPEPKQWHWTDKIFDPEIEKTPANHDEAKKQEAWKWQMYSEAFVLQEQEVSVSFDTGLEVWDHRYGTLIKLDRNHAKIKVTDRDEVIVIALSNMKRISRRRRVSG